MSLLVVTSTVVTLNEPLQADSITHAVRTDVNGNVGRWDPCSPLQWKVMEGSGNGYFMKQVRKALKQFNVSTGLNFVYAGKVLQGESGHAPYSTLVISLSSAQSETRVGGTTRINYSEGVNNSLVITSATLHVNSRLVTKTMRSLLMPVLLHELGHVAGLAHVSDSSNIMNPVAIRRIKYSQSDVQAFAAFSAKAGCHPVANSTNL